MPHDAKGQKLNVGDDVLIPAKVTQICEGEDFCNCTVELEHKMPPNMTASSFSAINTRQVEKK